jgi:MraZ protein
VAVFIGTYDHSLDPKGRVIPPRKFRDELGQDMVITKGVGKERCLYVFPLAEFEAFASKLHSQPLTARSTRDFARMFVAGASPESADSQGRVVIPQPLREFAGLTKDVVLLGQIRRVVIWEMAEWERYPEGAEAADAAETNASHLAELGS